jgi:hypothetical protein
MTLSDWLENRWLTEHESSPREIADLLALAERDLQAGRDSRPASPRRRSAAVQFEPAISSSIISMSLSLENS